MKDQFYDRTPHQLPDGAWQLHATALAPPIFPSYPAIWFCTHESGEYHTSVEDALACPQYL